VVASRRLFFFEAFSGMMEWLTIIKTIGGWGASAFVAWLGFSQLYHRNHR
jgi:hypothetical protein